MSRADAITAQSAARFDGGKIVAMLCAARMILTAILAVLKSASLLLKERKPRRPHLAWLRWAAE
jgi:hypothetical protein